MKLHGWQRLWVVISAVWTLVVVLLAYFLWPSAASLTEADVYKHMSSRYVANLLGGVPVQGLEPSVGQVASPMPEGFIPNGVASPMPKSFIPDGALLNSPPPPPESVAGHTLQFAAGTSQDEAAMIVRDYRSALYWALSDNRRRFFGGLLAVWAVPPASLYVLGWAIGWVRRGFAA